MIFEALDFHSVHSPGRLGSGRRHLGELLSIQRETWPAKDRQGLASDCPPDASEVPAHLPVAQQTPKMQTDLKPPCHIRVV
jgi:hypothetical protein